MSNKIILGDCVDIVTALPKKSIDICITSPPYKDEDGYSLHKMSNIFMGVYDSLKDDSLLFVNFGHLASDKLRPFELACMIKSIGFNLNDTITWVKNHYTPLQGNKRLNNLTEFIFMFYKGNMPDVSRLAIGVPYKDKSNVKRFAGGNDLKCGGNVWYINYETRTSKEENLHPDHYPVELPLRCLKLSGLKTGTVLDPFGGSGTTGVAAKQLGLNYFLIEKQEKHYKTMMDRLLPTWPTLEGRLANPLTTVKEAKEQLREAGIL